MSTDGDPYAAKSKYRSELAAEHYAIARFRPGVAMREAAMVEALTKRCGLLRCVLDAPSGTGRFSGQFPGSNVVALDISPQMASHARMAAWAAVVGDVEHLPFAPASFDLVLCARLLHHLPSDEILERCLRELARVSAGYVLVSYYRSFALQHMRRIVKNWLRKRSQHRLARSWSSLKTVAARAGLEPVASRCSAPGISEQWFVLFRLSGAAAK